MLKPVKREQIADAIGKLESKLTQEVRRVLVVEDDERQRESIHELLASDGRARSARSPPRPRRWRSWPRTTFDCMVMDLSLPDLSGFELLQEMSATDRGVVSPGHRLHRALVVAGRGAAAAAFLADHHHQGRPLARTSAG